MTVVFPFDDSAVDNMAGKTMVLSTNHRNESVFVPFEELEVETGGDCKNGCRFEVLDGKLRLLEDSMLQYIFEGIEARAGVPYVVGWSVTETKKDGYERVTLHEKKTISASECGVCVSSHLEYEDKTIEPLLKSLKKTGFEMSKVLVVVGGDARGDGETKRDDGVRIIRNGSKMSGFVGLSEAMKTDGFEYWLLVHDTCDFEKEFVSKLSTIDVGLRPDVILLRPVEDHSEMGFYSSAFLKRSGKVLTEWSTHTLLTAIMAATSIMTVAKGKISEDGDRDVYGTGVKRRVLTISSVGIRKFEGRIRRGGRP